MKAIRNVPIIVKIEGGTPWSHKNNGKACLNDCHVFKGSIRFPIPCKEDSKRNSFAVKNGGCCSPECCKRFIIAERLPNEINRLTWLRTILKNKYGIKTSHYMAPPREVLSLFTEGGMSIEEYRKKFKGCTLDINNDYPLIVITQEIYELTRRQESLRGNETKKPVTIELRKTKKQKGTINDYFK